MVHEKYIKRGNKVFGPYLYTNYRENGKTKTRYLGKGKSKKGKNLRVNKDFFIALGIVLLVLGLMFLVFRSEVFFDLDSLKGRLATQKFLGIFVNVTGNQPPEILNVSKEILVCENDRLNYQFNVTDKDGVTGLTVRIEDIVPFYIRLPLAFYSPNKVGALMVSDVLGKQYVNSPHRYFNFGWALHEERIIASDGPNTVFEDVNITVIEVNNAPSFFVGVQTIDVYTRGENDYFYYDIGDFLMGNFEETPEDQLIFNLTFLPFEGVDWFFNLTDYGVINITGNESLILPGLNSTTYWINVTIDDDGIVGRRTGLHPNISQICHPGGWDELPKQWSSDFYLTITKENRDPIITSYYPSNLTPRFLGTEALYFNATAYDPDWTPLNLYWYVDGVEEALHTGLFENNVSEFEYVFGCGISGVHTVTVVAKDGLANDTLEWNVSVGYVNCPRPGQPGGGGGPSGLYCEEKWVCDYWNQCELLEGSFDSGRVTKEEELLIEDRCELFDYDEDVCGFQIRKCKDLNSCGTILDRPGFIRECYYTEFPDCADGILNCHSGSCEVLVDCGGPCDDCPSCSDGIKNQDEEDIDCGGICDPCVEKPFMTDLVKMIIVYSLLALLLLVLILVARQLWKYKKYKKEYAHKIIKKSQRFIGAFIFIFSVVVLLFFANMFINNLIQKDRIVLDVTDDGFLGSRSLINSFLKGFADRFLISISRSIYGSTVADLGVWNAVDLGTPKFTRGTLYGKTQDMSNVYFYANYSTKTGYAINVTNGGGSCEIAFYDAAQVNMTFNSTSLFWEYNRSFVNKGSLRFNVNCTSSLENLNLTTTVEISNTPPQIELILPLLEFLEDNASAYNFSLRVLEDDQGDQLVYTLENISNSDPANYPWITMQDGHITVDATLPSQTGFYDLDIKVEDSDGAAMVHEQNITINPINDAPTFDPPIINQSFNTGDPFQYLITVSDEEGDDPFVFGVDFLSCSNSATRAGGNCTLFPYTTNAVGGWIDISFTPGVWDVGSYIINFSVMDYNILGNRTTWQLANFTVTPPIWNDTALNSSHNLTEDSPFYLNVTEMILHMNKPTVSFVNGPAFDSFTIVDGIINVTPTDQDVGYYQVEITANDVGISSFRNFDFTIENINDSLSLQPLQASGVESIIDSNIQAFENDDIAIYLFIDDNDLWIPQKNFYNENFTINLTIVGPHDDLFTFEFDRTFENNSRYVALFKPMGVDGMDLYNITINVTDANNHSSALLKFNLTIMNRDYDTPNLTYPNLSMQYYLKENITYSLIFKANHTVQDDLDYMFYIDGVWRETIREPGDDTNITWFFTPEFTDETYGEVKNLTLVVMNPYFSNLNVSRTWNLSINHTNAPVQLISPIGDKMGLSLNYALRVNLSNHFSDIDYYDPYYNQTVDFTIDKNGSVIAVTSVLSDWTFVASSASPTIEMFNVTMYDIDNATGEYLTNTTSNNFLIEFVPPTTVPEPYPVPVPTPSRKNIVSLKIIVPGQISVYEYERIKVPLRLVNEGDVTFNDLDLASISFKDGDLANEVRTELSRDYIEILKPGQEENLTLTVFFDTNKIGNYEVLVNATSKKPKYMDWGKIHINLQRINETKVRELIVFSEEFIVQDPACVEIKEIIDEAKSYLEKEDFVNAQLKAEQAIDACKDNIAQVSVPRRRTIFFTTSIYLVLAILVAFVISIVYYFLKRRRIQKMGVT
jgi:hypothetical protein